jgi:ArsR family transcriptional regulator, lead/cadmium/zinc/bismuth-responsive transcriptional repressor
LALPTLAIGLQTAEYTNMQIRVVTKSIPDKIPALGDEQLVEAAEILRLLGEPSRLRILLACLTQPASVGEIAIRVGIARSLVSHHLRLLRASRLLHSTRNGKQIIYSSKDDRVRCIVADLIAHVCESPPEENED